DIAPTNNREGQVSVSSQLSQKSTRNTADKERHRRVLQDTEVPLVDDVLQVVLIPGRLEIRPVERLVAESAGELGQNVRVGRVADLISLVAVGILHAARVSDRVGQNVKLHGSPSVCADRCSGRTHKPRESEEAGYAAPRGWIPPAPQESGTQPRTSLPQLSFGTCLLLSTSCFASGSAELRKPRHIDGRRTTPSNGAEYQDSCANRRHEKPAWN